MKKKINIPLTGASGGAILNPSAIIPTKLLILDPCHNNAKKK